MKLLISVLFVMLVICKSTSATDTTADERRAYIKAAEVDMERCIKASQADFSISAEDAEASCRCMNKLTAEKLNKEMLRLMIQIASIIGTKDTVAEKKRKFNLAINKRQKQKLDAAMTEIMIVAIDKCLK